MASFRFRSLETDSHVRILYLDHGADDEALSGSLVHHNLDEHPVYNCLSYVWGCPKLSRSVLVDGTPLPITANLHAALKRMRVRDFDGPIAIWADGICINQNDIPERNQQVNLMRRIYSECQTGLMYLGEAADQSDQLPAFLNKLVHTLTAIIRRTGELSTLDVDSDAEFPGESDAGWTRLRALLHRPWFRRMWIVQEFALPPQIEMICGHWTMPGLYLAGLFYLSGWMRSQSVLNSLLDEKSLAGIENHMVHLKVRETAGYDVAVELSPDAKTLPNHLVVRRHQSLIWLLHQSHRFLATDPRDKIFALIPLSADARHFDLVVDYSKSVQSIALETAQHLARNGYGLSLLLRADSMRSSVDSPSWFPDWTSTEDSSKLDVWPMRYDRMPECQILPNPGTSTITVVGSIVDTVQKPGVLVGTEVLVDENNTWIGDVDAMVADIQTYPTGQSIDQVVWRTLIRNQPFGKPPPAPDTYGHLYQVCRLLSKQPNGFKDDIDKELLHNLTSFDASMLRGYRFSVTTRGLFSMLPEDARVGDGIFVVQGDPKKATFLVRRDAVLGQYRLVGQAYVHGIWDVLKHNELKHVAITIY